MSRSVWLRAWLLLGCCISILASAQTLTNSQGPTNSQIAALTTEMNQALARVRLIVNQPVTRLARQRGMQVRIFSPGWFHEGAMKPDFNTVDVRTTQERPYDQAGYVTSDLNPGVVFIGSQLEFNSMTKYFYADRSLPKKKLSEPEMVEINRLYRIIGRCEQQLDALQNPAKAEPTVELLDPNPDLGTRIRQIPKSRLMYGALAILGVLLLYGAVRKLAKTRS